MASGPSLPDSLVLEIFLHLPHNAVLNAGLACHQWLAVSRDEFLWRELFYTYYRIPRSVPRHPGRGAVRHVMVGWVVHLHMVVQIRFTDIHGADCYSARSSCCGVMFTRLVLTRLVLCAHYGKVAGSNPVISRMISPFGP